MSNYSSQNRLLALEKELYRWKQAPQNEQIYQLNQDEPELGDTLETIEENLDDINNDEEFEQSNQESSVPLNYRDIDEFIKMDNLSYSGLASILSNNANQRFNRNIAQIQTQEDELAPLPREKMFGSSKVTTIEQPTPKPTLELPEIELPEPDSTELSLVSDTTFSDIEASYSSLLKALQEARLNNFENEAESDETENKD